MKNLKYLAYAVPCCMALTGTSDGIFVACITSLFMTFILAMAD